MWYNNSEHKWHCPYLPETSDILSPIKSCWEGHIEEGPEIDWLSVMSKLLNDFEHNPNIQIERKELHVGTTDMAMVLQMESRKDGVNDHK